MTRSERVLALAGGLVGGLVAAVFGLSAALSIERWAQRRRRRMAIDRDVRVLTRNLR